MRVGVYAGANSSMASLFTVHSNSTVNEFFDGRPQRNPTIVQSKQGMSNNNIPTRRWKGVVVVDYTTWRCKKSLDGRYLSVRILARKRPESF